jgi:hypothetical protein
MADFKIKKKCVPYEIPLSTTHVAYDGILAIHKSNAPFPVTRTSSE